MKSNWEKLKSEIQTNIDNMEVVNEFDKGCKSMMHTILNLMTEMEDEYEDIQS